MGIGASFWWQDALPHQPVWIREETLESGNPFSSSWISASVPKFCYPGDTLVQEEVWMRQLELGCELLGLSSRSYRLFWWPVDCGASHRMKGKIFRACIQSVLTYGTETWAKKTENLHRLERAEHMIVRWMCGVSLKDKKWSEDLYSLLGVQSMAKVMRRGRLRWFGHVERKNGDDWVSACRNVVVAGVRWVGRGRKT